MDMTAPNRAIAASARQRQASLSKRGQHSQSIDPSRLTNAAVVQSPISA
jgi:hypothetical protein